MFDILVQSCAIIHSHPFNMVFLVAYIHLGRCYSFEYQDKYVCELNSSLCYDISFKAYHVLQLYGHYRRVFAVAVMFRICKRMHIDKKATKKKISKHTI